MGWVLERDAYSGLLVRLEAKSPLRRHRRRWKDNNKIDLQEVGWRDKDWIDLPQDRCTWRALVKAVMNIRKS
jgi:hypothetical protein